MMTQHVDAFGKALKVDDEVVYTFLEFSRYHSIARAVVTGFTPQKVKIVFTECRHNGELQSEYKGIKKTVPPYLLVNVKSFVAT